MMKKLSVISYQLLVKARTLRRFFTSNYQLATSNCSTGFTLVETLAAITLIMVAIVAPMALTVQSLSVAYYARDQITASNLAQEGIEAIRAVRDGNVLATAEGNTTPLFQNIFPQCSGTCYVDATKFNNASAGDLNPVITACSGACPPLQTNGQLYGYNNSGWTNSNFTRTISACYVQTDGTCPAIVSTVTDEVRLTVVVSWQTAAYKTQSVTLSENLFNWVSPGSGKVS